MKKLFAVLAVVFAVIPAAFAADYDFAGHGNKGAGKGVQVAFSGGQETWAVRYSGLTVGFEQPVAVGREEADPTLERMWNVDFATHPEVFTGATAYLMNTGVWGKGGTPIATVDVGAALASAPVSADGTIVFSGVPWNPIFDQDGDGLYWGLTLVMIDVPTTGQRAWLHHSGFQLKNGKLVAVGPYAAFDGKRRPVTVIGLSRGKDGAVKIIVPSAAVKAAVAQTE